MRGYEGGRLGRRECLKPPAAQSSAIVSMWCWTGRTQTGRMSCSLCRSMVQESTTIAKLVAMPRCNTLTHAAGTDGSKDHLVVAPTAFQQQQTERPDIHALVLSRELLLSAGRVARHLQLLGPLPWMSSQPTPTKCSAAW